MIKHDLGICLGTKYALEALHPNAYHSFKNCCNLRLIIAQYGSDGLKKQHDASLTAPTTSTTDRKVDNICTDCYDADTEEDITTESEEELEQEQESSHQIENVNISSKLKPSSSTKLGITLNLPVKPMLCKYFFHIFHFILFLYTYFDFIYLYYFLFTEL